MIVTCESCGTKFKVDETKFKKPVNKVRCSKCKHVFTIKVETSPEDETVILDPGVDSSPSEEPARKTIDREPEEEGMEEPASHISEKPPRTRTPRYTRTTPGKPPVSRSKVFTLMALPVLLIAVGFAYYFFANPTKKAIKHKAKEIPPVSISQKTEAFFIENVHAGQMLVVQGEVINKGSYPISFVMLEGKVYGPNKKVAISQRFYAGNILTKEELAQLPITEIQARMLHREGDNLSNVHIKPGNKVPFMVVFYNLPPIEELTDYGIEYVNAEVERPAMNQKQ